MKIRTDFVTNSSSASFILSFRSPLGREALESLILSIMSDKLDSWFHYEPPVYERPHDFLSAEIKPGETTWWKDCSEVQKRKIVADLRSRISFSLHQVGKNWELVGFTPMHNDETDIPELLRVMEVATYDGVAGLEYLGWETNDDN